jgi:hypothetical protein
MRLNSIRQAPIFMSCSALERRVFPKRIGPHLTWRISMNSPNLAELLAQHRVLEGELLEAMAHPASSDAEIAAIKRRKLKLKDEIAKLQGMANIAA